MVKVLHKRKKHLFQRFPFSHQKFSGDKDSGGRRRQAAAAGGGGGGGGSGTLA